jgi:hypothetical protein
VSDLRYRVVVCPSCRGAFAFGEAQKGTSCPRCQKRYKAGELQIRALANSSQEAITAVREVNRIVRGETTTILPVMTPRKAPKAQATRSKRGSAKTLAATLETLEEFSHEQFELAAEEAGVQSPEKYLERMLLAGVVAEVKPGVFRLVGDI